MSTVYAATRHDDPSVEVAVKCIAKAQMHPDDMEEIVSEVQLLRELDHPHVVRFDDAFVRDEDVCIVMQFCEGGDLAGLIQQQRSAGKRLPEAEVRGLLLQLASALAHMHALRVVHRDIKSSNVFLLGAGADGASHHAMLGDFGVAKALESTRAMACTQCGTPYYLPPEVCNGAQYNAKADMWSLGVLAYELCALRYPFAAATLPALVMAIVVLEGLGRQLDPTLDLFAVALPMLF